MWNYSKNKLKIQYSHKISFLNLRTKVGYVMKRVVSGTAEELVPGSYPGEVVRCE